MARLNGPRCTAGQLNFYDQNERFTGSLDSGQDFQIQQRRPLVQMEMSCCPLYTGSYWATARLLLDGRPADRVESALQFDVETGRDADPSQERHAPFSSRNR